MTPPTSADSRRSLAAEPVHDGRDPGSYRDPAGFVFRHGGRILRQVDASFRADWDLLIESGLHDTLTSAGLLIRHVEVDPELAPEPSAYRVIEPDALDVVTYPYEWSFGQLKDAALLTLQAQALAADHGMTLRDASAYNVQFQRGRPILIDTLSFERAVPDRPWDAYRQFCEHFLAPLALMARVDVRLGSLQRSHLDGIPLDLAARLLPARTRVSLGLGPHIHLHARAQRQHADDAAGAARSSGSMSASKLATLVESLRTTVAGLNWEPRGTAWAEYDDHTSYDTAATAAKAAAVEVALRDIAGRCAWDLGANTGRYARIAADLGYRVVALDVDPAAVERGYRSVRADGRTDITPLLGDITDPSPPSGWGSAERRGLLERIAADADVVLALALVHHLAIGANVPLPMIASLLARLAPHALVEWVPKDDPMTQRLLTSRRDVFERYTLDGFRAAFAAEFEIVSEVPIEGTRRTLFRLARRG